MAGALYPPVPGPDFGPVLCTNYTRNGQVVVPGGSPGSYGIQEGPNPPCTGAGFLARLMYKPHMDFVAGAAANLLARFSRSGFSNYRD